MTLDKLTVIEHDAIKNDVHFYLDLILGIIANRERPIATVIFNLTPYFSLFIIESLKYFNSHTPKYATSLPDKHRGAILRARRRVKFFDNPYTVEENFDFLDWIVKFHYEWFVDKHQGALAPIIRELQNDMGVFFYDTHIFSSNYLGIFDLGYTEDDVPRASREIDAAIGPQSRDYAAELSRYIMEVANIPEFARPATDKSIFAYNLQDKRLGYRDERSEKFLPGIFNVGESSGTINLTLLICLCRVNYRQGSN